MWISQLGGEVELEVLKFHVGSLKSNKRMCYSCWAISKYLPQILGDLHRCLFVLSPPKCQIKVVKCLIFQNFGGFSKITWSKITWSAKPPLQFLAWNILLHLDFVLAPKNVQTCLGLELKAFERRDSDQKVSKFRNEKQSSDVPAKKDNHMLKWPYAIIERI